MDTVQQITGNFFLITILSSTVIATIVGILLGWVKEHFQQRSERKQKKYENLYGPLTYHLLEMKVLNLNRTELLAEILKEPRPSDPQTNISRFADVNPLIIEWQDHNDKFKGLLESQSGYIEKSHLSLVEDYLDGYVKRVITNNGTSIRTTNERTTKMLVAIETFQEKLLGI